MSTAEAVLFLFTRRQRAVYGCLYTHTATVREREKLAKRVSHRYINYVLVRVCVPFFLFTRRQRAVYGCLYTHTATVREREKLAKRVSHRYINYVLVRVCVPL